MRHAVQARIGIYAGSFNPVHAGHIAFALQSAKEAKLDKVYFMPERQPRHKRNVEHLGHRAAMLKSAVRPHPDLEVLETDDVNFTVQRTLPMLRRKFKNAQLVFLFGSDIAAHIHEWPLAEKLFAKSEIIIGLRGSSVSIEDVERMIAIWPPTVTKPLIIKSHAPDVSSHKIREALAARTHTHGLLMSVKNYSKQHWLYVSLAKILVDKA